MAATIRSTEITTPTDLSPAAGRSPQPIRRRNRAIVAGLSLGLGISLLYLAIPRTIAAWAALEAQPAIEKLQHGKPPSDAELAIAAAALLRALDWVPSARRMTDLTLIELVQAQRRPVADAGRAQLLDSAERHLTDGLADNPANGFSWLRLAIVRELREAPPRQIAAALAASLDMAPNMRKLWLPRAAMLFVYWQYLTYEELLALRTQLRTIWATDPASHQELIQASSRSGTLPLLAWSLGDSPPSAQDMERLKAAASSTQQK